MQLFIYITPHPEVVSPLMNALMQKGIPGATTVDCRGMLSAMNDSDVEAPPIFGSLRKFLNPDAQYGKLVMSLMKDEDIPVAKDCVHAICGNLKTPNTGIMFSLPVMNWEGVSHK